MTSHQEKQIAVINGIEEQINNNTLNFSTVAPIEDYENDPRMCLTSVHLPGEALLTYIHKIITSLQEIEPDYYYYPDDSLHITIKTIRVINDPPHFTQEDVLKAENVFSEVLTQHHKFAVYFYRLLLFPNNLALIGTTDPEFDSLFLDLDQKLADAGIPDDKIYNNSQYFFCNVTLARFSHASEAFKEQVAAISQTLVFEPYIVDSVTLLASNAVLKKRQIFNTWQLP